MKTQIAYSEKLNQGKYDALLEQAERLGAIRSEVWQCFGSVNSIRLRDRNIRNQWIKEGRKFNVSVNSWKEMLRDTINSINSNREAAKTKVKQAIRRHTGNKDEQKHLYYLLKYNKWTDDKYLSRIMRKYWRRGHNHTYNQIIVRSDIYKTFELNGRLWIKIPSLIKYKPISIPLNTNIAPTGTLRIILRNNKVEIHYATEIIKTNDCGTQTLGVDKGFTEVLTDSDGKRYGTDLGKVLNDESDKLKIKYQRRNKLKHIAKEKPWVTKYNLGRKKLSGQSIKHKSIVKTIVHTAVNQVVDKAKIIVTEDLTSPITGKKFSKNINRRLSSWTKGVIARSIEDISRRRGSSVIYVNAAYTSQMDSRDGTLSGRRVGNTFHCENKDVLDADINAARNILARAYDSEIDRWAPYQKVKSILLKRTACHRLKLLNQDSSCSPEGLSTESELPKYIYSNMNKGAR
jgi:IS605 OrfB family transposase